MHLHILGIAGTFMSALAILAREAGYKVTGCDANCYPPISDLLKDKGIIYSEGYEDSQTALKADKVIVGNAIKRGMPVIEAVLNAKKPFTSGPQWLAENILRQFKVLAVAGTHGKTTTTSMLAFILDYAGKKPSFLIGGVAPNFNTSARLSQGEHFVIEADEYDSAFFDKRPKLMHYQPEVAILNNLEFDHADIYADLAAIKQQFHYYLKTIPSTGLIIKPAEDKALNEVLTKGCYSELAEFSLKQGLAWQAEMLKDSGEEFLIIHQGQVLAEVKWSLLGQFNVENALAAFIASIRVGVKPQLAAEALAAFKPVKRRLELKAKCHEISIYDDFAHHPTAIKKTIHALKASGRHQRILLVLEFASYTMRAGIHQQAMTEALGEADKVFILQPQEFALELNLEDRLAILPNTQTIIARLLQEAAKGDAILIMSNRGFANIHQQLIAAFNEHSGLV